MMLHVLEHDDSFEMPRSVGACRDQTAGEMGVKFWVHSRRDRYQMHMFAHLVMI